MAHDRPLRRKTSMVKQVVPAIIVTFLVSFTLSVVVRSLTIDEFVGGVLVGSLGAVAAQITWHMVSGSRVT